MKIVVLFGFILMISGCATAPPMLLISGASKVIVAKSDPSDNYEIIGPVSGLDGEKCNPFGYMGTYERATTSLRNKTYNMGGNYAQLISITEPHLRGNCFDNKFILRATAYKKVRSRKSPIPFVNAGDETLTKKLRELKSLLVDGILTNEEYTKQKTELLEKGF